MKHKIKVMTTSQSIFIETNSDDYNFMQTSYNTLAIIDFVDNEDIYITFTDKIESVKEAGNETGN